GRPAPRSLSHQIRDSFLPPAESISLAWRSVAAQRNCFTQRLAQDHGIPFVIHTREVWNGGESRRKSLSIVPTAVEAEAVSARLRCAGDGLSIFQRGFRQFATGGCGRRGRTHLTRQSLQRKDCSTQCRPVGARKSRSGD